MPNITIEYVILIPMLFVQVIVFPFVASTIASTWQENQRIATLQQVADHMASTVQQLYLTVNPGDILAGTMDHALRIPETIDSHPYTITGSLSDPPDPETPKILTFTLTLIDVDPVTATALMGPNVEWNDASVLLSDAAETLVHIQKFSDGTIVFSFGAD
jgi:hypothetical protein